MAEKKTKQNDEPAAETEPTGPVEETPAPIEETPAPAEETAAPVEEEGPVEETPAPVEAEGPTEIEEAVVEAEEASAAEETPAAGEAPAPEAPAPAAEAPAAPGKPAKSGKHLPRSARRQRPKPVRDKPAERKPIVRLEKPAKEIGRHQERRGIVVSEAMDKTIVVKVELSKIHPRYKKVIRRSRKFHAHDERNEAHVGDVVRIIETRPLSKTKNWRLVEIVEAAR